MKDLKKGMMFERIDVLVEKRSEGTTKRGSTYLTLTVRDKSVSLSGKLWDFNPEMHHFIQEGAVINISGIVEEYNGALQLVFKDISESLASPDDFIKKSGFDVEEMWGSIVNLVGTFKEPLTKFVAEEILLKHEAFIDAFKKAPAASKVHNAWYGGLLEHVHALCAIAEPVIKHYKTLYCEKLSRDKVLFGLIMHDAGKIIEYDYKNPAFPMAPIGILTNHLVMGPAWVYETANRFTDKSGNFKMERAHLMHVLAAHHGTHEWGSPVKPSSLEALLVHHLDNLDSKMMHAFELVKGKQGSVSGFSERSYFEGTSYLQYQ